MAATLLAFGLVFVAEVGDKSQLLALALAARYGFRRTAAGLVLAATITTTLSVAAGGALGAVLQGPVLAAFAGALFLIFGVLSLREALGGDDEEDLAEARPEPGTRSVVLTVATALFVAEMGDKTMIATAALAAQQGLLATWAGALGGFVAAGLVGALLGRGLRGRVSERTLGLVSGVLFAIFGVVFLIEALAAL